MLNVMKQIKEDVEKLIKEKYGDVVNIEAMRINYGDTASYLKIELTTKTEAGLKALQEEDKAYLQQLRYLYPELPEDLMDLELTEGGRTFKVVGFNKKARKNIVIIKDVKTEAQYVAGVPYITQLVKLNKK